jgi:hypothetical protein
VSTEPTTTDPTLADIKAALADCMRLLEQWAAEITTKEVQR